MTIPPLSLFPYPRLSLFLSPALPLSRFLSHSVCVCLYWLRLPVCLPACLPTPHSLVRSLTQVASSRPEAVEAEILLDEAQLALNSIKASRLPESSLASVAARLQEAKAKAKASKEAQVEGARAREKEGEAARPQAAAATPNTTSKPKVEPKRAASSGVIAASAAAAAGGGGAGGGAAGGAAGSQQTKAKDAPTRAASASAASSGSKAGAGSAINLEDEMAKVQAVEERKQAAKAKKAARCVMTCVSEKYTKNRDKGEPAQEGDVSHRSIKAATAAHSIHCITAFLVVENACQYVELRFQHSGPRCVCSVPVGLS